RTRPPALLLDTAVAAALGALFVALLPLLVASAPSPVPFTSPGTARTSQWAPLLTASGDLLQSIPANTEITVLCWYFGNPHAPWLGDGLEYHVLFVVTPKVLRGHVPDPYLTFGTPPTGKPPAGLRRCPGR